MRFAFAATKNLPAVQFWQFQACSDPKHALENASIKFQGLNPTAASHGGAALYGVWVFWHPQIWAFSPILCLHHYCAPIRISRTISDAQHIPDSCYWLLHWPAASELPYFWLRFHTRRYWYMGACGRHLTKKLRVPKLPVLFRTFSIDIQYYIVRCI